VLVLTAGPVLGLVYAAFLPFIGIAMLLKVLVTKAFGGTLEGGALESAKVATFNWSPSRAFLAGKRAKKAKGKDEKTSDQDKTKQE
jgi:mannose/fructose/N-acetylgalactosamine-specific phosphotransferase system component IIC